MRGIVFVVFILSLTQAFAQNAVEEVNTTEIKKSTKDTVELISYATRYNPKKAALFAAVVPGLGQIYNKKYWKLPLVYGGFIGLGYGLNFYNKGYTKYKSELFDMLEPDAPPVSESGFTEDQLRTIVDRYRRERDFFMILMAGMYLLQIVDAHVDAHLKEFDLNPNLHVRIEPVWESDMVLGQTKGIALKFRF